MSGFFDQMTSMLFGTRGTNVSSASTAAVKNGGSQVNFPAWDSRPTVYSPDLKPGTPHLPIGGGQGCILCQFTMNVMRGVFGGIR